MKRRDLIKLLEDNGWYLKRHSTNHDIYIQMESDVKKYHGTRKLMNSWQKQ